MNGHRRAIVKTVDSDILVLSVAIFSLLGLDELWLGIGTKHNYKEIPVHEIANSLGHRKARALLLFHPMTGCDTTSQMLGCGKKTGWSV